MEPGDDAARRKIWELIKDIRIAMMTTRDGDVLRSRPMASHQSDVGGALWFFTRADAPKTDEIADEQEVNLSFAEPDSQVYVSISGRARVLHDPAKARELWNPMTGTWFPDGPDDPNLRLIRVEPERAEFWDGPSSRMVQLYRMVEARVRHAPPDMGENRKIGF